MFNISFNNFDDGVKWDLCQIADDLQWGAGELETRIAIQRDLTDEETG